jgi:hypothetical protein
MSVKKRIRGALEYRRRRRQVRRELRADRKGEGRGPHDTGAQHKDDYRAGR